MNLEFDKKKFTKKKGDYHVGPVAALDDAMLYARTQEYKRRLSGQMRPISGKDLFKIPKAKGFYGMKKYDGEFALLAFDGEKLISVNPGGTVRYRPARLRGSRKAAQKGQSKILPARRRDLRADR